MIDMESEIFDFIAKKIRAKYDPVYITGEIVKSPPIFPCVSIVEMDNQVFRNTQTSSEMENHAQLMYEVNIYSNLTKRKKSEVKGILAMVDNGFAELGFTRIMASPIPNDDVTIYRAVARYRAIVSKDKVIYRR